MCHVAALVGLTESTARALLAHFLTFDTIHHPSSIQNPRQQLHEYLYTPDADFALKVAALYELKRPCTTTPRGPQSLAASETKPIIAQGGDFFELARPEKAG